MYKSLSEYHNYGDKTVLVVLHVNVFPSVRNESEVCALPGDLNNTLCSYFVLIYSLYYLLQAQSLQPCLRISVVHAGINETAHRSSENRTDKNSDHMGHFLSLK